MLVAFLYIRMHDFVQMDVIMERNILTKAEEQCALQQKISAMTIASITSTTSIFVNLSPVASKTIESLNW